ncbi:MAG: hypothetical protein FWD63_00760 [Propionibacteriaceae bacterium]|nr:hypothetical protein [Propionibacteriaceae bacterium]
MRQPSLHRIGTVLVALLVTGLVIGGLTGCSTGHSNPKSVVQGYLNALAKGDAKKALSYEYRFWGSPTYAQFLNNETLAYSNAHAPLTVISIDEAQVTPDKGNLGATATVTAKYAFGDHQVTHTFSLNQVNGSWYLDYAYADENFQSPGGWWFAVGDGKAVGLTLNGLPWANASPYLFPGAYQLATDNSLVTMTGGSFFVDAPDDGKVTRSTPKHVDATIALTSDAKIEIGQLANTKFYDCLGKPGALGVCVFRMHPTGKDLDQSTLMWKVAQFFQDEPPEYDMTQWDWGLSWGTVMNTGSVSETAFKTAYAALASGNWADGTPIDVSKGEFQASVPWAVCVDISNPANITVSFSDGSIDSSLSMC